MPIGLYIQTNLEMRLLFILNKRFVHLTLYCFPVPIGNICIFTEHKHFSETVTWSSRSKDLDG